MSPLSVLLISSLLLAQKPGQPVSDLQNNWSLAFSDEFNGPDLDLSRWVPRDPLNKQRGRQFQSYIPEAVQLSGGQLHLTASRAPETEASTGFDGNARSYISGVVSTFGTFAQTYGRFEIRCRVPAARGLRPGFQLLPVPLGPLPEIDVFELPGNARSDTAFSNRWGTEQTQRSYGDSVAGPDLSAGFHTIAVEWDPDKIIWFIDGKEKFRSVDGVPHQPMYLLLYLAVDGKSSPPAVPASFDIDYIRVYQHR